MTVRFYYPLLCPIIADGLHTGVLVLVDVSHMQMTKALVNKAKEAAAAAKAVGIKDKPNAVVGLTGLQKAVAQLFGREIHFANTVDEAKEWLVKEDDKRR